MDAEATSNPGQQTIYCIDKGENRKHICPISIPSVDYKKAQLTAPQDLAGNDQAEGSTFAEGM